jgi:hypothetical protein
MPSVFNICLQLCNRGKVTTLAAPTVPRTLTTYHENVLDHLRTPSSRIVVA